MEAPRKGWTPRRVADLGQLSDAERQVLDELGSGNEIRIGDGLPESGDAGRRVLAALIRLLLLGDDSEYRLHERGLRIRGAWVPDQLNLDGCRELRDLHLLDCRFRQAPSVVSAEIRNLFLNGSRLPGLDADGLEVGGSLMLRGVEATGTVRLTGAVLGGDLSCNGARFRAQKDEKGNPRPAFIADRLKAGGSAFLREVKAVGAVRLPGAELGGHLDCGGAVFRAVNDAKGNPGPAFSADRLRAEGGAFFRDTVATGEVRLVGAVLGASLDCTGAKLRAKRDAEGQPGDALSAKRLRAEGSVFLDAVEVTGAVWLLGAAIGGDLSCRAAKLQGEKDADGNPGDALLLEGVSVKGTLLLREGATVGGVLDLTGAELGSICDARRSWPPLGDLGLDLCSYGAFTGGPTDGDSRKAWLALQYLEESGVEFWPQPYEQCAKVLREMGHGGDARAVLIEKERRQRAARRARAARKNRLGATALGVWDAVAWATVGYGRQPLWAFAWLLGLWLFGAGVFSDAYREGAMRPTVLSVVESGEWARCVAAADRRAYRGGAAACYLTVEKGRHYQRFQPLVYSAETLLPGINLDQRAHWTPNPEPVGGRGWWTRGYLWVHTLAGWALGLLAIAGFSGLVKSD
jgi:hypothetical protein